MRSYRSPAQRLRRAALAAGTLGVLALVVAIAGQLHLLPLPGPTTIALRFGGIGLLLAALLLDRRFS
jgi:hypothetical protein